MSGCRGMIVDMRVVCFILCLLLMGGGGCGPDESDSMREQRAARTREANENRAFLKASQQDVRDHLRQLGVSTR
jgi:hypothetical protein